MDISRLWGGLFPVALTTPLWLFWTKQLVQKPNRPRTAPPELEPAKTEPGVAQSEPQPVSKKNQPTCFRISGIPPPWDGERLEKALRTIDPEFDRMGAEISGPFPGSYGSTQTALLDLNECTQHFTFEPKQEKQKVISENGQKIYLVLDKHSCD